MEKTDPIDTQKPPQLMGVLNVTPDSFSDGGRYLDKDDALKRIETLITDGADIIDIGAESTRPGSKPISVDEEIARLRPILSIYKRYFDTPISLDTQKAEVAEYGLTEGVGIINDISAFSDPKMLTVLSKYQPRVCIMHMQGTPQTMQKNPDYTDIMSEIMIFFKEKIALANEKGLETLILDPGIGFGKTVAHNLTILRKLSHFTSLNYPLLIGTSNKSFIGQLTQVEDPKDRLEGTLASNSVAILNGASILRVHDVKAMKRFLSVFQSCTPPI